MYVYKIESDGPQGCVLGPVLHTLYTSQLPISHHAYTATFADDIAIMAVNKTADILFLYSPQRGYISFVNTFVTPRNNDLEPYVPWRHLISAKF